MKQILILASNMAPGMAQAMSEQIDDYLRGSNLALVLPIGLDHSVPVSIEVLVVETDNRGAVLDVKRLGFYDGKELVQVFNEMQALQGPTGDA